MSADRRERWARCNLDGRELHPGDKAIMTAFLHYLAEWGPLRDVAGVTRCQQVPECILPDRHGPPCLDKHLHAVPAPGGQ